MVPGLRDDAVPLIFSARLREARAMTRDEAITRALREVGLRPHDAAAIRRLLETPRDAWPSCCGSFCDPCVATLARAADRARALEMGADPGEAR